jgi:hypothetical protein
MSYLHDPTAVLDGQFDWSPWLDAGETITAQTVVADGDLSVSMISQTNGVVTYWLSGGTATTRQRISCHITTNQGRQDERSVTVQVVQR